MGLIVSYPSDWSVDGVQGVTTFVAFYPSHISEGIGIEATKTPMSPEDEANESLKFHRSDKQFQLLGQGPATIGERNGYELSTLFGDPSTGVLKRILYIFLKDGDTVYNFHLASTSPEKYSEMLPIFQQMIASSQLSGISQGQDQQGGQENGGGQFNPFEDSQGQGQGEGGEGGENQNQFGPQMPDNEGEEEGGGSEEGGSEGGQFNPFGQ